MKCDKCKTELFKCDIVGHIGGEHTISKEEVPANHPYQPLLIHTWNVITHDFYRCPKCFTVKKVKVKQC